MANAAIIATIMSKNKWFVACDTRGGYDTTVGCLYVIAVMVLPPEPMRVVTQLNY